MGIKEQVYLYSPVFMQNLLTTLYGYRLQRERYGPAYQTRFQELADKLEKPIDVERDQLARLNTFLLFCRQHSPYYHTLFKDLNLQLPFRALTELRQIPSLEKEMLRQQIESIRTDLPAPILGKTGGTTGKSIQVRYTKEDMQVRMAHLDFF